MKKRFFDINLLFDGVILVLIIMSSLILPMDNPLNDPDSRLSKFLENLNVLFTFCFLLELIVKIIAKGFLSN